MKKNSSEQWKEIIAWVCYMVSAPTSSIQLFPYWSFTHYTGLSKTLSSNSIDELFWQIGLNDEAIQSFLCDFREEYFRWKSKLQLKQETLITFALSKQTAPNCNDADELGFYDLQGKFPDIKEAMFVDETTGIPLCYEHFYGSILDNTQTPLTANSIKYGTGFPENMEHTVNKVFLFSKDYINRPC